MRHAPLLVGLTALVLAASSVRADEPKEPPPPPTKAATLAARLPVVTGAVPGSPAISIQSKPAKHHCSGVVVTATVKKKPAPDRELAAVFALKPPTKLSFSPDNEKRRAASLKKFETWFTAITTASKAAADRYRAITADAAATPADRLAASARLVQVTRWVAQVLLRFEHPTDVAAVPEAADILCDMMAEKAEPLVDFADQAATACRELSAASKLPGWWDGVCAQ